MPTQPGAEIFLNQEESITYSYEDGYYCADVYFTNRKVGTSVEYELDVEIKDGKLVYINTPEWIDLEPGTFDPPLVSNLGACVVTKADGISYDVQINKRGSCSINEEVPDEYRDERFLGEQLVQPGQLFTANDSWAKQNFIKYLENLQFHKYRSRAQQDIDQNESTEGSKEEEQISKLFNALTNTGAINLSDFNHAVEILGLQYTMKPLSENLSIVKFRFGTYNYYLMMNTNTSTGYTFEVYAMKGNLKMSRISRNVSCSYVAGLTDNIRQSYDYKLQQASIKDLCLDF